MGNSVIQKNVLSKYAHDAVEMESAIYTLDKMKEECEEKKSAILDEMEYKYINATDDLESAKQDYMEIENKGYISPIQEPQKTKTSWGCFGVFAAPIIAFILTIAVIFVVCVVHYGFQGRTDELEFGNTATAITVILSIIVYLAGLLFFKISDKKDNEKATEKFQQDLQKAYEEYNIDKQAKLVEQKRYITSCERVLESRKRERAAIQEKAALMDLQMKDIADKREKIKTNLDNFYSLDIIPPDYRTFDCVMMLDQIFRNDLADTMREAILLYEDRVFKGSVIKGMDRICSMLGCLSNEMNEVRLRLDMINSSVNQMGDDLNRANDRLMNNQRELIEQSIKNHAATEELIKETQLGRYTNEKLLESNEILAKYAKDKRSGII